MPRGKAPTFEQQRAVIHAAAAQLFAERGYAAASITDLARACGVSKGLLYHYFRDKEHLLFAIADRHIDRLQQIAEEVAAARGAPDELLAQLIERLMIEYEHAAARHRVLVQDVKYLQRAHRLRVRVKQRRVVHAVAQLIARAAPQLAPNGSQALLTPVTMILFGMVNWTFTWLREGGPLTYRELAPIIATLFLHGVRGLPSTRIVARTPRRAANRAARSRAVLVAAA